MCIICTASPSCVQLHRLCSTCNIQCYLSVHMNATPSVSLQDVDTDAGSTPVEQHYGKANSHLCFSLGIALSLLLQPPLVLIPHVFLRVFSYIPSSTLSFLFPRPLSMLSLSRTSFFSLFYSRAQSSCVFC